MLVHMVVKLLCFGKVSRENLVIRNFRVEWNDEEVTEGVEVNCNLNVSPFVYKISDCRSF
jgi:hypothetical protein